MTEPLCPGCCQRDARIAELERRVAELEALARELLARLGQNASNSSLPPSANPPGAPAPVVKKKTRRKPGGQPGPDAGANQGGKKDEGPIIDAEVVDEKK